MACFLNIRQTTEHIVGHSWAFAKERCKLDIRKDAFSQRTINEWQTASVNMFKYKIDNYF